MIWFWVIIICGTHNCGRVVVGGGSGGGSAGGRNGGGGGGGVAVMVVVSRNRPSMVVFIRVGYY